jgi:hypothetical protein
MENSLFSIHFPSMDLPLLFPSFLPLSDPVRRDPAEALQLWVTRVVGKSSGRSTAVGKSSAGE